MRRTQGQWRALIAQHQTSGQTQHDFCTERDINPKYFSALKQRFGATERAVSPFVKASPSATPTRTENILRLSYHDVTLDYPASLPADYLVTLIKALA
ncbi:hypothetical protein N9J26_00015 [bacterium]|nr:hypothetical protein [bacterium]